MRLPYHFFAAVFLLTTTAACVNMSRERESATSSKDPRAEFTPPSGRGERVGATTVLNTVRASHAFSNSRTPDNFLLQLRGPRIVASRLHLIVLKAQGDTLCHKVLPVGAVLDEQTVLRNQSASVRDQEISILRGMNTFFSDEHFTADRAGSVTFHYPSGTGSENGLLYSRSAGRVTLVSE